MSSLVVRRRGLVAVAIVSWAAGGGSASAAEPAPVIQRHEVTIGIRLTSPGAGKQYTAGTPIPIDWPEQRATLVEERAVGCRMQVHKIGKVAAVLIVNTPVLRAGETVEAIHRYHVETQTQPPRFEAADFPAAHPPAGAELLAYLRPSPGIQSDDRRVRELAQEITAGKETDLEKLAAFFVWAHNEIEYRPMDFTSAVDAIERRIGDCEEKASVFIALARSIGIPARTVTVPGHCWAEFHLVDRQGEGHWLPAHTSGIPWFGELGTADVILSKGDNFRVRASKLPAKRVLTSWVNGTAPGPRIEYIQEVATLDDAAESPSLPDPLTLDDSTR